MKELRFVVGFPFGLVAESIAWLAAEISGGQCDLNFNRFNRKFSQDWDQR